MYRLGISSVFRVLRATCALLHCFVKTSSVLNVNHATGTYGRMEQRYDNVVFWNEAFPHSAVMFTMVILRALLNSAVISYEQRMQGGASLLQTRLFRII
jgi:hypothetical protein